MGYIAKGSIRLNNVNDAYTVSLSKPSCIIHADFDGSNLQLDDAQTTIKVSRGEQIIEFDCAIIDSTNNIASANIITYESRTSCTVSITNIPANVLNGIIPLRITADDGYTTDIEFGFTVVRESTMLDWIQDWEGGKTKIGNTYVMTPKMFIGKKSDFATYGDGGSNAQSNIMSVPGLTGVYIGPDSDSTGIYGYKSSVEIFHINSTGGMIGGWEINSNGIFSSDGLLSILSEGTIKAVNSAGDTIWQIRSDGYASFAKGNIKFYADGSADYVGKITASEGLIGGWNITDTQISKTNIYLGASENAIGVLRSTSIHNTTDEPLLIQNIQQAGGVAIHYTTDADWGLIGYNSTGQQVFSLGSENIVAGWNFDNTSLWSGTKNNTTGAYTTSGITIGSNGLRGAHWYIDTSGSFSFMDGKIQFSSTSNSGNIVGWMLNDKRFSTNNIAIVSDDTNAGIFMSAANGTNFNNLTSASLTSHINSNGGIYMKVDSTSVLFTAYNEGKNIFQLKSNGASSIANWNIENDALYIGVKDTSSGTFTPQSGSITLSNNGIYGYKWRFEADGSGALAGDKIIWDADGNMTINATLSGNNITSGTISKANIKNDNSTWYLNQDGSGALANKKIIWDSDGNMTINATISGSNITAGTISKADIKNTSGTWYLNQDGSGALANDKIIWDADGNMTINATLSGNNITSGTISKASIKNENSTWYLNQDGSGSLANNKIIWDTDGNMTINATLSADNITSGTISTADIKNASGSWYLNQDGSGVLADGNILWDANGSLSINGKITATSGKIGNWYIVDGTIASTSDSNSESFIKMDASNQSITIQAASNNFNYGLESSYGAIMTLDANSGVIRARAKNAPSFSTATSYISSNGIFSNIAQINCLSATSGCTHRGAIVGLGYANIDKSEWGVNSDETIVAGVYGRANNKGTAAAYGGFFYQLKACGFTTSIYYFTTEKAGTQLPLEKTTVIGLIASGIYTLYLPINAHEGQEVEIIQQGSGITRIDTNDGTHIYDDMSENDYYDCEEGDTLICKRVRYFISGTAYDIWVVRKYNH